MSHALEAHREAIDHALEVGASKASIARNLSVSRNTLLYYLDTRDLPETRKEYSDIQAALARLAADVQ